jgi:hypothetical protein
VAKYRVHAASLVFRQRADGVQVLLLKCRSGRRWKLPQLRVRKHRLPRETAALAAYRKAGVSGSLSTASIGDYRQGKGEGRRSVLVFALEALEVHSERPKPRLRRQWVSLEKAARRLQRPELEPLLLRLPSLIQDARLRQLLLSLPELSPLRRL